MAAHSNAVVKLALALLAAASALSPIMGCGTAARAATTRTVYRADDAALRQEVANARRVAGDAMTAESRLRAMVRDADRYAERLAVEKGELGRACAERDHLTMG